MAGRHRPPHVLQLGDQAPPLLGRAPLLLDYPPPPLHPSAVAVADDRRHIPLHNPSAILALEDRLVVQSREIEVLLMDNQALAATHVALKQEVVACQHQLRIAAADAARIKADRDAELREIYERSMKAEAEAVAVESMQAELVQVRADVQRLAAARDELVKRLQGLRGDLARSRADRRQAAAIVAEIEMMQKEVHKGRAAVEYEKKAHSENIEQNHTMEQNMIKMACEVEKLRAELANLEKRAKAAAAAVVATNPGFEAYGYENEPRSGGYLDMLDLMEILRWLVMQALMLLPIICIWFSQLLAAAPSMELYLLVHMDFSRLMLPDKPRSWTILICLEGDIPASDLEFEHSIFLTGVT